MGQRVIKRKRRRRESTAIVRFSTDPKEVEGWFAESLRTGAGSFAVYDVGPAVHEALKRLKAIDATREVGKGREL